MLLRHPSIRIVLHDLILHHSQFLRHLHGFLLVSQHVLGHLVDNLLAALHVFLRPLNFILELLNLVSLLECESVELVLFSEESITGISDLAQLIVGTRDLPFELSL